MYEVTLSVPGMTSGRCVRAVSSSVTDIAGVRTVAVDLESKTVRVTGDIDAARISEAIIDAGYDVGR